MVLRFSSCSSRGPGFLAPVVRGLLHKLSASVGAPEAHDFAVRDTRRSSAAPSRPSHPAPRFVTTARTPLLPERDGGEEPLIWWIKEAKYLLRLGWTTQIRLNYFNKLSFAFTSLPSSPVSRTRRSALVAGIHVLHFLVRVIA